MTSKYGKFYLRLFLGSLVSVLDSLRGASLALEFPLGASV
jgi:hypothetical protein